MPFEKWLNTSKAKTQNLRWLWWISRISPENDEKSFRTQLPGRVSPILTEIGVSTPRCLNSPYHAKIPKNLCLAGTHKFHKFTSWMWWLTEVIIVSTTTLHDVFFGGSKSQVISNHLCSLIFPYHHLKASLASRPWLTSPKLTGTGFRPSRATWRANEGQEQLPTPWESQTASPEVNVKTRGDWEKKLPIQYFCRLNDDVLIRHDHDLPLSAMLVKHIGMTIIRWSSVLYTFLCWKLKFLFGAGDGPFAF